MSLTLVACLDVNSGIGDGENLLFHLPNDLKRFKSITSGKVVVMGRKTWDSLPIKPLPKRKNFVLTMNEEFVAEGATVIHDIEDILEMSKTKEVFVIGGSELYFQLIDEADYMMLTHVHTFSPNAKNHFPDFDSKTWKVDGELVKNESDSEHEHAFTYANYKRVSQ